MGEPLTVNISGSGGDMIRIEMSKADLVVLRDMAAYAHVSLQQNLDSLHFESWDRLWGRLDDININDYVISGK